MATITTPTHKWIVESRDHDGQLLDEFAITAIINGDEIHQLEVRDAGGAQLNREAGFSAVAGLIAQGLMEEDKHLAQPLLEEAGRLARFEAIRSETLVAENALRDVLANRLPQDQVTALANAINTLVKIRFDHS